METDKRDYELSDKTAHIKAVGATAAWAEIARLLLSEPLPADAEVIYTGRNKIVKLTHEGVPVAVKFFSRSVKNRLIYSIFSSKAARSYLYAQELERRGIGTPTPLAYAERRGAFHTLQESVYICKYEDGIDLKEYLERGAGAWDDFARFAATLHKRGILHRDLNNTNVRIRLTPDGKEEFSLIDLNRIKFLAEGEEPTLKEAANNLVRFSYHTPEFNRFALTYSQARRLAPGTHREIIKTKLRHERK